MKRALFLQFIVLAAVAVPARGLRAQSEDLSVLGRWLGWSDAANALQHHLNGQVFELLEKRRARIRALSTAEDWNRRRAEVRSTLEKIVGPFPPRTPLRSRITGSVQKEGYRIEKVVFESRPGFHVTACLFVPAGLSGKAPAILNLIGHTDISFRAPSYQQLILNLVKKGFIVFAVDPVGQGERLQYYDAELKRSLVGGSTTEHSYFGRQCFLAGSSAARYFAWDGIRAIDYLVTRPEVDAARIGVTGISGGGTQTAYVAALDDRVAAAAPTCYIAGFQRLLESIGPQDAEQNLNNGLLHGIDHADLIEVRAPKPTLIVSTTRDFFSIQGARETYEEARAAYRAAGSEQNLSMIEDDFGHGYTKKTREGIYSFFQKHLNLPGDPQDEARKVIPVEEITVTATGQLIGSLGGETVFSVNRAEAQDLFQRLDASRRNLPSHLDRVRKEAPGISGYLPPPGPLDAVYRGRHSRPGYFIEMHALHGEGRIILPLLLMIPDRPGPHPAVVYLDPRGKSAASAAGGDAERLVRQGYAVLAPDLSGMGETGRVSDSTSFLAMLAGRSVAALRAGEIVRCVQFLKGRRDVDGAAIAAVARSGLSVPLLHAAAFNGDLRAVALFEGPVSFESIVKSRFYNLESAELVANALTLYDLPDLAALVAPRRLVIVNPAGPQSRPAESDLRDTAYEVVRRAYSAHNAADNFSVHDITADTAFGDFVASWLKR